MRREPSSIRPFKAATLVTTLLVTINCAETSRSPTAASVGPTDSRMQAISGARATGSGHTVAGGEPRTFAFGAVGHPDGSASGSFQIVIHAIDAHIHVATTCMRVRNDTAWVAGIIAKSNHPVVREGTVSYFWASDGGEGPDAVDKVSTARINDAAGEDQRFCTLMPDEAFSGLPGNVVLGGNVQVH